MSSQNSKTPRSSPAVIIDGLRFAYGPKKLVLDIPSLQVQRGERVFLFGPSGSGKTTLLGVLAGILQAQTGSVQILGQDFAKLSSRSRDKVRGAHIGYIFQMFNLIPYLNVMQNILLPCHISSERQARIRSASPRAEALKLAQHLGIEALVNQPVTELSVGQQQRVAAARALIGSPDLIIADEPTSALDADHREAFLKVLFAEAEAAGAAILFVSHDHGLSPLFERSISLREINQCTR